ncbi:hypothetical protein Nepgr_020928 [Nepenthes gracilis]|uniref:Transmembrane protein n=1 Tax=Nepenthes gracilis TaxID=150966 RepID=A0AAD3SXV2_NEPGR|nr:hypothetical protein Nepgr_020928 [Nepenthes gracilis]
MFSGHAMEYSLDAADAVRVVLTVVGFGGCVREEWVVVGFGGCVREEWVVVATLVVMVAGWGGLWRSINCCGYLKCIGSGGGS